MEGLVNRWIQEAHPVQTRVMALAEAKAAGAVAMFGEKYADTVRTGLCAAAQHPSLVVTQRVGQRVVWHDLCIKHQTPCISGQHCSCDLTSLRQNNSQQWQV